MNFEELKVKPEIVRALNELGITEPTTIQEKAIPFIKQGKDVIGMSKTGSGKTAAFGIPILEKIEPGKGIQVLIMSPTRELAGQIEKEMRKFGKYTEQSFSLIYGGVGYEPQIAAMKKADIVVGTPGRLLDHLQRGNLKLKGTHMVVLDEADKMVDMGFIEDIEKILSQTAKKKQMLLFGATISGEVERLKKKYMHDPETAKASSYVKEDVLEQYYYDVKSHEKFSLLIHLLKKEKTLRVMIFCSARKTVELVTNNLKKQGIKAEMTHGKLSQNRREQVMEGFHKGDYEVLVASAVAARGLHVQDVTHVINYDVSQDPQEYVHRVGRTARAGESGKAITLLSEMDHDAFRQVLRFFDVDVKKLPLPQFPNVGFDTRGATTYAGRGRGGPRSYGRSGPRGAGSRSSGPRGPGRGRGPRSSFGERRDSRSGAHRSRSGSPRRGSSQGHRHSRPRHGSEGASRHRPRQAAATDWGWPS
jgi:ATP-dependent RNA helicase DeaD